MKAIMMSIRPQHVVNILNGEKTIEIRKKFPKDYVGWVYIYVTQNHKHAGWKNRDTLKRDSHDEKPTNHFQLWTDDMVEDKDKLNGKVVARFWCDKVGEIEYYEDYTCEEWEVGYQSEELTNGAICSCSCLSDDELDDYLQGNIGYAVYISDLEIFDEPKEISEFYHYTTKRDNVKGITHDYEELTRAPQSYCFIEID